MIWEWIDEQNDNIRWKCELKLNVFEAKDIYKINPSI